jgi:ketosteroid isomerase-like protein
MSMTNVELARWGFAAVARGDLDAVREFLDPEVKWHGGDSTAIGTCPNRDQALRFMRQASLRVRDRELVDVIDAGDKVVVLIRSTDEDGQSELGANVTTFRDGRVIEMVHYPDPDDALAAARGR